MADHMHEQYCPLCDAQIKKLTKQRDDLKAALRDVLEHFEWSESGSEAQQAYDAAVAAIGNATDYDWTPNDDLA